VGGVGLGRVRLRDRHRVFQADGDRQPLQDAAGGLSLAFWMSV
jgi:hypothetical protein